MKPIFVPAFLAVLVLAASATCPSARANDDGADSIRIEQVRKLIAEFQSTLKSELTKAIEEGGPEKAISVCNEKAPQIAKDLSVPDTVSIGRTALGFRNPDNAPDAWEKSVLLDFISQKNAGVPVEEMVSYKDEGGTFRYMKAIPMQPLCATCHGEAIDKDLYSKIKTLYPDDTAINYKLDDIRGAFTVTIDGHRAE